MLNIKDLKLQQLDKASVKTLVCWAMEEGWNPGRYDYDVFWKTDPKGFYGFYFNNNLIAGGSIISYTDDYGFMGLFIVHPDFRGKGIGKRLWYLRRDLLIKRLKKGSTIGMDGVVRMQPFYQRGGFKIAFTDERYECEGKDTTVSKNISSVESSDFDKILKYDINCFGFKRSAFLAHWLKIPNSKSFKYLEGKDLQGYALIRQVELGFKIGPLFANNDKVAEELYKSCLKNATGHLVYLDIPTINEGAKSLVKKYGAKYVFECARMYHGEPPPIDINKVYGITTFELG